MREKAGRTFAIAEEHPATPGCTTSFAVHEGRGLAVSYFSLAAETDISAETHPRHKLLVAADGSMDVDAGDGARHVAAGESILVPAGATVGMATQEGCTYTELNMERETIMNQAVKAGDVFRLGDLVPYQDGTIVNMDVAHNGGMKLALMSFDAGCGLSEHSAPGEALVFALDGEGVIGYEGQEHAIHAGECFKFDKNGRHYVRAEKRFKMALLLTLQ